METAADVHVWGSELRGSGILHTSSMIVGLSMILLSLAAVVVSAVNLYAIKKLRIFHNAFGAFWMSKAAGEIGYNLGHILYTGPVTALQPKNIPPSLGIAAYICEHYFAAVFCVMNQCVSINRLIAVCFPLKYKDIFSKRITGAIIIFAWLEVSAKMSLYFVLPCSLIGYSPQFYERAAKEEEFRRNVRFFAQTAVQNFSMMASLISIVLMNNDRRSGTTTLFATIFDAKIVTSVANGLCLIFFNPEVRRLLGIRFVCTAKYTSNVEPSSSHTHPS
ncbi:hypothetical protein QR680_015855 [Steinernema hermaphroditum]|uniref:7TM GPCR serpentine receptor class x (Srx) domain-containing protein n=1 Tax=Steinernema hermaphroditum TaxID=289476 RepID=A0AA39LKY0_9BILA|nr:hypothetical protein QR680_015855 [Steinernema hermaphroditum]